MYMYHGTMHVLQNLATRPSLLCSLTLSCTCHNARTSSCVDSRVQMHGTVHGRSTYRVPVCTAVKVRPDDDGTHPFWSIFQFFNHYFVGIGWTTLSEKWYDHSRTGCTTCDAPCTPLALVVLAKCPYSRFSPLALGWSS